MKKFMIHNPVEYIYGVDALNQIGILAENCGTKALIVTYNQEHFLSLAKKIENFLNEKKIQSVIYSEVEANPTIYTAIGGSNHALQEKCDFIIGIGGGSALDTAKGIAHCVKHGNNITDYMYGEKVGSATVPFILIPTTAGTGSEGNNFAVFTNPETHDKKGVVSTALYAHYAILDPVLLTSLPKKVIAGPGLDVLFHSIEAYTSKTCTPIVELYALEAIRLVGENLLKMYNAPKNLNVCQNMQFASLLGGICIGMSGVGIPHALDHPIGGLYNIVHAEGLAALYPACLEFIVKHTPEKFVRIAKILGKDITNKPLEEQANLGKQAIIDIIKSVDMNISLSSLNVQEKDIDWIINNTNTIMSVALKNSVGNPTDIDLREIILKSL